MKKEQTQAILDDMRRITMLTGEISNVHEASLKKWPYIVFENVQSVSISYDLTKQTAIDNGYNHVVYNIFIDNPEDLLLESRSKILTEWIRDMFWNEIEVKVTINKKVILHSIPNKKEENNGSNEDRA
jgi:hypothetical protein